MRRWRVLRRARQRAEAAEAARTPTRHAKVCLNAAIAFLAFLAARQRDLAQLHPRRRRRLAGRRAAQCSPRPGLPRLGCGPQAHRALHRPRPATPGRPRGRRRRTLGDGAPPPARRGPRARRQGRRHPRPGLRPTALPHRRPHPRPGRGVFGRHSACTSAPRRSTSPRLSTTSSAASPASAGPIAVSAHQRSPHGCSPASARGRPSAPTSSASGCAASASSQHQRVAPRSATSRPACPPPWSPRSWGSARSPRCAGPAASEQTGPPTLPSSPGPGRHRQLKSATRRRLLPHYRRPPRGRWWQEKQSGQCQIARAAKPNATAHALEELEVIGRPQRTVLSSPCTLTEAQHRPVRDRGP